MEDYELTLFDRIEMIREANKKYDLDKWIAVFFKRFTQQQFKRSCLPDGPKIGSVSLSPRGDWRMPSDSSTELWQ